MYQIHMPEQKQALQTFHINMLKKWNSHPTLLPPEICFLFIMAVMDEEEPVYYLRRPEVEPHLDFSHLEEKGKELLQILPLHLFRETRSCTEVTHHPITLKDPKPLRQPVYRVPECQC